MDLPELAAWLRLLETPGVGPGTACKLLAALGSPQAVFAQSAPALAPWVSPAQAAALQGLPPDLDTLVARTWAWLCEAPAQRRILALGDPLYPQSLLEMADPPVLLYAMGPVAAWERNALNTGTANHLAVVGSRNPTPQGASNAHQFARAFAEAGYTVVSGLALGVDGAAHAGALEGMAGDENTLATLAVVGTGLDRVYPRQHHDLAHRIGQHGVLLSEFALGTGPLASNFPRRNRLISGLCCGVLVVEAAPKSGSLITAQLAAEQGREVFAIPGSIHALQSRGCHALIRQGAKLVETAQDVLEELPERSTYRPPPDVDGPDDTPTPAPDGPLLRALGYDASSLDALQARTGLPTSDLLAQLMELELQGQLSRLPGGLYQRVARA